MDRDAAGIADLILDAAVDLELDDGPLPLAGLVARLSPMTASAFAYRSHSPGRYGRRWSRSARSTEL